MKKYTKETKWKTLGEICEIERGTRVKKKDLSLTGNYPVVSGGTGYMGYLDKYNRGAETITIAQYGTAGYVNWQKNKFWANDVCFSVFPKNIVFNRYLYYFLKNKQEYLYKISNKTAIPYSISKEKILKIQIPLPPLKKQAEIAAALDKFTELTEELTKELTAREAQYEYYRNMLLSENYLNKISEKLIKEFCPGGVEWKKLGEVCEIGTGKSNTNEQSDNGKYPFYVRSKDIKRINKFEFDETSIIIPGEGGIGEIFHYVKGKYALHQRAYRIHIIDEKIITKFIYYYLMNNFKKYIMKNAVSSTITSIRKPMIENFEIPIPPIEIQNKIIDILDNFETLVNDIRQGLPREIELRQKQYEYYREKLLTFEAE